MSALATVREILWTEWDPIGTRAMGGPPTEYDGYADGLLRMIERGAGAPSVAGMLEMIERDRMGLASDPERAARVARALVAAVSPEVGGPANEPAPAELSETVGRREGQAFRSHGYLAPVVSEQPRGLMEHRQRSGAFRATVLTLFPGMFPGPLGDSLTGKALKQGLWALEALDIRRFARDKHRSVDDTPTGGGPGMVLRPDVVAAALDHVAAVEASRPPVIALSPRGRPLAQARVVELACGAGVVLLCGRFEGIDQRVLEARGVEEVSIGDYVLSGGELAAMVLLDAVIRLRPGVLGNSASTAEESFSRGLLEHPQYTRPPVWEGRAVPEVLLSGHHARIAEWRRTQAEALTKERRPDLWAAHLAARGVGRGEPEQSDAPAKPRSSGLKKDD